jgi:hypothetical protein
VNGYGKHLLVDVGFRDAHTGMPGSVVVGAAVIGVESVAVLRFLPDLLAGDRMPAMAALDDVAGVDQCV